MWLSLQATPNLKALIKELFALMNLIIVFDGAKHRKKKPPADNSAGGCTIMFNFIIYLSSYRHRLSGVS